MPSRLLDICNMVVRGHPGSTLRLPEQSRLAQLALNRLEVTTANSKPKDIVELAREISTSIQRGEPLSRRQARQAPWCLWHEQARLAEQPEALRIILSAVSEARRPGAFSALATAFADRFDAAAEGMNAASDCLQELVGKWETPWAKLHHDFSFFHLELGPQKLAAAVVAQNRPAAAIVAGYGVGAMGARSGYVRAVTISMLDKLAEGGEPDHLKRLEKVERYALDERGEPTFDGLLGKIAEALLKPFGQARPEKTLRDRFLSLLLRLLGDPRVRSPKNKWHHVPPVLTGVVRGWLTEQSLRQFLDIVDVTAMERMWKYRRAFWEAVYDAGLISEAWVAFGPDGEQAARRAYGRDASFARLEKSGRHVEPGHAVLLLRIGDGIVADWSHNGKYNIWMDHADPSAPRLYKSRYGSDELRILEGAAGNYDTRTKVSRSHTSPDRYGWQNHVSDVLYRMTGVRVQPSTYQVR
jgi:hypothetical protein